MEEKNKDTIQWTDEQAHVINTRRGNLLVSAAAGSGKTAVLVERIIEMVTGTNTHGERVGDVDPVDVDELLVVTFTNAAAAQMKEKVGKALQKKIDEMSDAGEYDEHLIRQMTLINHAEICTIDSFCLRIVKEYFSRVQLDAAFDIADNAEMEIIRKDVLDNVMEMCYADDQLIPGFRQLVKTFARKEKDGAVTELVEKLVRIVSSYPEPYRWLQDARDAVAVPQWAETDDANRRKYIMGIDMVAAFADEVKQIIYSALNMAREIQEYTNEAYQMESYGLRIDRDVDMLVHMSKLCDSQDTVDLFELKDIYEKSVRQKNISPDEDECGNKLYYAFDTLGRNYKKPDPELKNLVVNRRTIYRDMVMEIMDIIDDASSIIEQARMMAPAIISLIDLTELYMRELMKAKKDKNLFEFHDIEEFAFQILCDKIEGSRPVPSEIGLQVAGRYREILVDEYQDSNFLQEYILGSVAGHGTGIRNMFMVGDVKQSIYGFRMARPDLFIGKYDSYRRLSCDDEADPEENGSCILLTRNFRSEINVLRTVNIIFSQLMMDSLGGIEYDDAAKLNSRFAVDGENGGLYEPGDSECEQGPESEYILIENKVKDLDPYGSYTNPQVEAVYIASRIDEIVNGESPLYVGHGEDRRKAEYRDIVILLRSVSTAAADFERVFADAGIPLYIESEKGYFDAAEISCLISMLSVIDNSYVDYDMAAVLRSPLVGLNEEELALIVGEYRAEYETEKKDYNARLYDKLGAYMDSHADDDTHLVHALRKFLDMLIYLKDNKNYMSISDILRYVLDETGYYWFAGARPMGKRRQANIDMLIKRADDFEKNSKGVFNFIRYVDKLRVHDLDFAEADVVSENENVVRVMTMHKSKGLEFPVVFVSNLGRGFNKLDARTSVLMHQDFFIASDLIDPVSRGRRKSFYKKVMARRIISETYAEEMRILYVALTRAKEKLYMTACFGDLDKYVENREIWVCRDHERMDFTAVMNADCYSDWIYTALAYAEHRDVVEVKKVRTSDFILSAEDGEIKTVRDMKKTEEAEPACEDGQNEDGLTDQMKVYEEARAGLEYVYPHRYSGLKSKMSITEIKKLQSQGEEQQTESIMNQHAYIERSKVPVPGFMRNETVFHGNEIGTIYHKIMEMADFQADTRESAEMDVNRVFELGLFDEVYRSKINPDKVYSMIHSSLGRRMAAADEAGELFREKQFYMMMTPDEILKDYSGDGEETIVVQGIIDAYFVENGEIILMDYKTDTVRKTDELVQKYRVQLDKYAEVLEQLTGMKVREKTIYSFCLDTTVNL